MSEQYDEFEKADATLRVLIVEDEPRLRDMLQRALPDMGFIGQGARSGEEAVKVMETDPHQILILDLNLPGMSGLELLELVRQRWPTTQVVVLTGFGDLETAQQAIRLDVAEFLTKPCPLGELEKALDHARRRMVAAQKASGDKAAVPPIFDEVEAVERGSTTLREIEREHILSALRRHAGNRQGAAEELGISVRKLYYRLAEYEKQGYDVR